MRTRHVATLLEPGTREEPVHPVLDVGELVNLGQATVLCNALSVSVSHVDAIEWELLTVRGGPWPNSNVCDGKMVTNEISGRILGEGLVHNAVETARFVDVAVQGVWIVAESGHCVCLRSVTPMPSHRPGPAMQLQYSKKRTLKVVCLALHGAEAAHLPKELVNVLG